MPDSKVDLEALKALEKEASPPAWSGHPIPETQANIELIVAMRNALPELIRLAELGSQLPVQPAEHLDSGLRFDQVRRYDWNTGKERSGGEHVMHKDYAALLAAYNAAIASRGEGGKTYAFLSENFINAMDDIGAYGHKKYGVDSFQHRRLQGDTSRGELDRTLPEIIGQHVRCHYEMHLAGIPHDHFGSRKHQLAAVAFNAMMEFYFSGLEDENTLPLAPVASPTTKKSGHQ